MIGFHRLWWGLILPAWLIGLAAPVACQTSDDTLLCANREIGVSFKPSYIAYDEYSSGATLDSEHGWIPGFGVKATGVFDALKMTNLLLGVTYDFNRGSSNHWSQSLSGGSPLNYAAPFRTNDVLFWVGKGFAPARKLLLTVEAESEYREWLRQLPQAAYDTREDYTFWAPGVALGASYHPVKSLVIQGKAGFEYTVSPVNSGNGNPSAQIQVPSANMILGSHPLWQFAGGADWTMTRSIHASTDADYSRFGFGSSVYYDYDNGQKYHYEPSSVTRLTRVDVGLAWSF